MLACSHSNRNNMLSPSCGRRASGDSGQGAEQEQEAGDAVPVQEEVGVRRGAGPYRGGEDGTSSARSASFQTPKILPLRLLTDAMFVPTVCAHTTTHTD